MAKKYVHYSNDLRSMINPNHGESTQGFYDHISMTHINPHVEKPHEEQENNYKLQETVLNNPETSEHHIVIQQLDNAGKINEINTNAQNVININEQIVPSQDQSNSSTVNITLERVPTSNIKVISRVNLEEEKNSKQNNKDNKDKPHGCDRCDFRTLYYGVLKKHIQGHDSKTCVICKLELPTVKKYEKHLRTVHNVKKEKIKMEKPDKAKLDKKATGEGEFECDICIFKTTKVHCLAQHKKMVHKELPYKCVFCDFTSNVAQTVKAHVVKQHTVSTTKASVMKRYASSYRTKKEKKTKS